MEFRLTEQETEDFLTHKLNAIGRRNSKVLEASLLEIGVPIGDRERGELIWTYDFPEPKKVCVRLHCTGARHFVYVFSVVYNYLPPGGGLKPEYRWLFDVRYDGLH